MENNFGGSPTISASSTDVPTGGGVMDSNAPIDNVSAPSRLSEYQIPRLSEPGKDFDYGVLQKDQQIRNWLSTAEFPKEQGSYVAEEVFKVSREISGLTEVEQKLWAQSEKIKLQRLWKDEYETKVSLAQGLIQELEAKSPGIIELLEDTRAGDSAAVISQIAFQAERRMAKRQKKGP